jgi:hypothetical protein
VWPSLCSLETVFSDSQVVSRIGKIQDPDGSRSDAKLHVVVAQLKSFQLIAFTEGESPEPAPSPSYPMKVTPLSRMTVPMDAVTTPKPYYLARSVGVAQPANVAWPVLSLCAVDTTLYAQDSNGIVQYNWRSPNAYRIFSRKPRKLDASSGQSPFRSTFHVCAAHFSALSASVAPVFLSLYHTTQPTSSNPDHCIIACENRNIILFSVSSSAAAPPAVVHTVAGDVSFECAGITFDSSKGILFLLNAAHKSVSLVDLCAPGPFQVSLS